MAKPFEFTPGNAVGSFIGGALQRYIQMKDRDAGFAQQKQMLEQRGTQAQDILQQQFDEQARRDDEARTREDELADQQRRQQRLDYERQLGDKVGLPSRQNAATLEWYNSLSDEEKAQADELGIGRKVVAGSGKGKGKGTGSDEFVMTEKQALDLITKTESTVWNNTLSREASYDVSQLVRHNLSTEVALQLVEQDYAERGESVWTPESYADRQESIMRIAEPISANNSLPGADDDEIRGTAEYMHDHGINDVYEGNRGYHQVGAINAVESHMTQQLGPERAFGEQRYPMDHAFLDPKEMAKMYREMTGKATTPFDDIGAQFVDHQTGREELMSAGEVTLVLQADPVLRERSLEFFENIYGLRSEGGGDGPMSAFNFLGKFGQGGGSPMDAFSALGITDSKNNPKKGEPGYWQTPEAFLEFFGNLFRGELPNVSLPNINQYPGGVQSSAAPRDTTRSALPAWLQNQQQRK